MNATLDAFVTEVKQVKEENVKWKAQISAKEGKNNLFRMRDPYKIVEILEYNKVKVENKKYKIEIAHMKELKGPPLFQDEEANDNLECSNMGTYGDMKIIKINNSPGGTISKWLFGTLDSVDGEKYKTDIKNLKQNQLKLIKNVNSQLSISKELLNKYSSTMDTIVSTQKKIFNFINQYVQRLVDINNEFHQYVIIQSIIIQIHINSNIIITFLENLKNTITFSKLQIPRYFNYNLKEILMELSNLYKQNEILNLKPDLWYSIIKSNCHITKDNIFFGLEFPIVYPESLQYYKLFPIPTKRNTIIIPPKPYLALKENIIQYMDQQCIQIEKIFLCDGEDLRFDNEDCVTKLIQNEQQTCNKAVIERPTLIINVISNEYLIILTEDEIQLRKLCPNEEFITIKDYNLIKIPLNCSVIYQKSKFTNRQVSKSSTPFILPKIK
ncbi:hypothetical protein FQA39_LY16708 [Lamprigera yunnana]|nr:hypothetical protein FQA39_LY16708 [Lamprigera yunnana]